MREQVIILNGSQSKLAAQARISGMPIDGSFEIAIRPHTKARSLSQNALMWGARYRDIAEQAWVDGRRFSAEAWHEHAKQQFLPEGDESNIDELVKDGYQKWEMLPDGSMKCIGSTTKLTKKGMSEYMLNFEAFFAGELGVLFSADRGQF